MTQILLQIRIRKQKFKKITMSSDKENTKPFENLPFSSPIIQEAIPVTIPMTNSVITSNKDDNMDIISISSSPILDSRPTSPSLVPNFNQDNFNMDKLGDIFNYERLIFFKLSHHLTRINRYNMETERVLAEITQRKTEIENLISEKRLLKVFIRDDPYINWYKDKLQILKTFYIGELEDFEHYLNLNKIFNQKYNFDFYLWDEENNNRIIQKIHTYLFRLRRNRYRTEKIYEWCNRLLLDIDRIRRPLELIELDN